MIDSLSNTSFNSMCVQRMELMISLDIQRFQFLGDTDIRDFANPRNYSKFL